MANSCPLCGGKIKNGECVACGFTVPDEKSIAAPYNYDPSDYKLEHSELDETEQQTDVREKEFIMPDVTVAENNPPAAPNPTPFQNPYAGQNLSPYAQKMVQAVQNKQQNQAPMQNQAPAPNVGNPYLNFNPANNTGGGEMLNISETIADFFKTKWYLILFILIQPFFGGIAASLIISKCKNYDRTGKNVLIACSIFLAIIAFFIQLSNG